ncbi:serine/threonine-protein kinase 19 isoform X1 [Vigna radiata var. radiata]|uniref:Serine/threonine-protein kinase 19 isoform X1 n=1 Tax=Vigna radiata var. radiata TaxID=3916 RepID=A0A1S3V521_VIGRR|nr:serine/threonine-protein kinase 19 isoform X1 [Vigna radiata var. radiata]
MENFPESSSKGTKRRRNEDSDAGNTSSLEDDLTFTDTSVALRIMRAQFPHIQKGSVEPFILKSQLYSSVKDRTQVDRELESLRRDKVLRLFKLNTGQDDHAVMFLDDYLNQIDRVVKRMEGKKVEEYEVFGWLKTHVLDSKLETGIEHQELDTKWFSVLRMVFLMQCSLLSLGGKVKDSHISVLINAGVLTRQLIDPNMYWFSIPNIGSHLKGIVQGRKEIISLLSRRRYKEMMLSSLEKKRLRTSPLDVRFHLRDLIGSGHLRTDQAPTGLIIRVSKD